MNDAPLPGSSKKSVLIYRTELLSYSETFIPAQAEKFRSFTPIYAGLKRVKGITLPPDRTVVAHRGPLARLPGWNAAFGRWDAPFLRALRATNPALVHAHFEDGGIGALPLAESLKLPTVVTCHGYDVSQVLQGWRALPGLRQLRQERRRSLLPRFALCIGISRFICDLMLRCGYPADKVRLHYIGVDVDRFRPDPAVARKPIILCVGRLVEKKGGPDLLRAMEKVTAKFPEVTLKMVGNGPLLPELQKFATEKRLNVEFCGVQTPEVIQGLLKSALLLCIPSVRAATGDSEGLGIVNLEAQASAVPIVGTLHGGIPESVEHGVTGLLSPERDSDALAENILTLLSDSQLREKMGAAGRERMLRHFNLQVQSDLLEEMYREIA